jgi:predicted DNA-binding transcriptional regulator AlpA
MTTLSRSVLTRMEQAGTFPARASGDTGRTFWLRTDVEHWIQTRPRKNP